jgi:predicted deacylase
VSVVTKPPNSPITIAGHRVLPGEREQFNLPAAQLYTRTPLDMPVEILCGRRAGPVLLVCAAIHGDELNGVEIIRRLSVARQLRNLSGTLVLVPVVNLFGFIHRSRYLPDRRDLNRCFPGSEAGSLGSRVAKLFFSEVVERCTHVVDLHTGAIYRENLPQLRASLKSPGVAEMAQGFGVPVIVNSGLIEGSLRAEADACGIPVITYEAGEALRFDERSIVVGVRSVLQLMRTLGMLPPGRRPHNVEPFIARSSAWVRAPVDGVFRPLVRLGQRVAKGATLGVVVEPFGAGESPVTATSEGVLIGRNNLPLVNEGEALFNLAKFDAADAVEEQITAHHSDVLEDPLYVPVPEAGWPAGDSIG